MVFYIGHSDVDLTYPSPGWYYIRENDDGDEYTYGPYYSKNEALDHMTDGAYSEYVDYKLEDRKEQELIDSGKGYLSKEYWDSNLD